MIVPIFFFWALWVDLSQQVLTRTPLNPTPATCHKRKRKLRCSFWNAALQKLHCNIRFSAVRKSFLPKAALQQAQKLHCSIEIAALQESRAFLPLSCGFQARLEYDLYDFFRGCFGPASRRFSCIKGPKTPPDKVM